MELPDLMVRHLCLAASAGALERLSLTRSMEACGMLSYPEVIGPEDGERCSGSVICDACGLEYYRHPLDWRVIGYGRRPYLNVLCDGRRVKL